MANATIVVVGIDHELVSTEEGEYWRLLPPGTFTLAVDATGYLSAEQTVVVESGTAKILNFTLLPDDWSVEWDFDLKPNLVTETYNTNEELKSALGSIENSYPTIAEALINEADWQIETPALKLSLEENEEDVSSAGRPAQARRARVLLVGGLYGSQPLGREILLRLGRHISEGVKQGENVLTMILKRTIIYIVPAVDMAGFANATVGSCHYNNPEKEMKAEAGNQFFGAAGPVHEGARALKTLMSRVQFDYAVSLEGNGMFIRVPLDDSSGPSGGMETVDWLASIYMSGHRGMNKSDPCHGQVFNGQAVPDNAFPTGVIAGHNIQPPMYRNTFLDFAWRQLGVPAFAAHISCCNYPRARTLLSYYKENLTPLVRVLSRSYQGVWGSVVNGRNKPLSGADIWIKGRLVRSDEKGEYLALLPVGAFKLEAVADGYSRKQISFSVEDGFLTRRDILLESSAESELEYHTADQILANLRSLEVQYPEQVRLYQVGDTSGTTGASNNSLQVIAIGGGRGSQNEGRPQVRLLGRGLLGSEIAANMADWLVTRVGHGDDTATAIVANLDIHIGFLLSSSAGSPTSELCPQATDLNHLLAEVPALAAWEGQNDFLVGLDFFAGSSAILPDQDSGLG